MPRASIASFEITLSVYDTKRSTQTTDRAFHALQQRYGIRFAEKVEAFLNGEIDGDALYYAFGEDLQQAHSQAASFGRRRAGGAGGDGITEEDRIFGRGRADYETDFLEGFIRDLEDGRYDDDPEGAVRRASQYSGALRGTGNASFVASSPDTAEFYWRLGGAEEHCEECPYLAEQSPYFADELPIFPGSNGTPCLFNCRCFLERSDGKRAFTAPD